MQRHYLNTRISEKIAHSAFEIVTRLNKDHFAQIVRHGAFADLTVCITEFCKVSKYQKISLLAIAMLRGVIPVMLECPECSLSTNANSATLPMDDSMIRFWFPVLFGFYDIIMNGEDLEVRRLYVPVSPLLPIHLTCFQSSRFTLHHPQDIWKDIPRRVLGHCVPGTSLPDIRSPEVESRSIAIQHTGGYECLAFNHDDTGSS